MVVGISVLLVIFNQRGQAPALIGTPKAFANFSPGFELARTLGSVRPKEAF